MKKLINALDRIAGLMFFALFICGVSIVWTLGGPDGIVTRQVHAIVGLLVFIVGVVLDIAAGCWYLNVWLANDQKLTKTLFTVAKSLAKLRAIYDWLTAD